MFEPVLVDDVNAKLAGPDELAPGPRAREEMGGLAGNRSGDLGAEGLEPVAHLPPRPAQAAADDKDRSVQGSSPPVVGDELVPYFNPGSQLLDQAKGEFSDLTHGFEFRVRYSFLTTWVRHYQVLPFAILLMLPAITWAAYLTVSWFVARVFTSLNITTVYVAAAFPTALFYLITIYPKITYF